MAKDTAKKKRLKTAKEKRMDEEQREVEECISYLSEANLSSDQRYCVNVLIQALVEMREEGAA